VAAVILVAFPRSALDKKYTVALGNQHTVDFDTQYTVSKRTPTAEMTHVFIAAVGGTN
jgi:hypothetical protein